MAKAIQSGSFGISGCQGAGFGVHVWVMPQQHDTEETQTEAAVNRYLCMCVYIYIYILIVIDRSLSYRCNQVHMLHMIQYIYGYL